TALDLQIRHLGGIEFLMQFLEPLFRRAPSREAEQEAEKDLPLPPVGAGLHPKSADLVAPEDREDVAERGVVVELEAKAGGVHEDEVAGQTDFQLDLAPEQRAGGVVEIAQGLLNG